MSSTGELFTRLFDQQTTPGAPKYFALRGAILKMIEQKHWQVGDKLPPEQAMTKLTGISLGTVQKALGSLADDGLLFREQGRGTFVASPEMQLRDPWHFRFLNEAGDALLPVTYGPCRANSPPIPVLGPAFLATIRTSSFG